MSDAFEEIQAIKIKRNSYREKLQKRKRERHELYTLTSTPVSSTLTAESTCPGNEHTVTRTLLLTFVMCDGKKIVFDFNI